MDNNTCKWCGVNRSGIEFERANLCNNCHEKAILAMKNPRLCKRCASILTDEDSIRGLFTEYGLQHLTADDLRLQSENGCELCRMFLLQDPNTDPRRLQFVPLFLVAKRPEEIEANQQLELSSAGDISSFYFASEPDQFRLELSVSAYQDDPASKYISQRPPESDLSSERTNQQIRAWLNECIRKHLESLPKDGQSLVELPHLPTRVLDVGTKGNEYVKLFQPPSIMYEHYITLSYCWGRPRFLTTTSANIDAHRERLDFSSLPRTFQDAITTTRNLGFRYLWIDALCIIQDSNYDKAKEICVMGDIYNNSFLTIAVVGATQVADGFLKTKPQRAVMLPYRCPNGTIGSVRIASQKVVNLWDESLYTRGWCLQENLLSRRLLLYTDTEVIWQCESAPMRRENTTHVSYLDDLPKLRESPFRRLPADILNPAPSDSGKEASNSSIEAERYNIWTSIVQNYTRRRLTVGSDRLPALDGIAQKFRKAWADEYFAGHWNRQFIPSLSWRRWRDASEEMFPPLSEYRAPSWSWASIDGPVKFNHELNRVSNRGLEAKLVSVAFDMDSNEKDVAILEASLIPASRVGDLLGHRSWLDHDVRITDLNRGAWGYTWCMLLTEGKIGSGKLMRTTALLLQAEDEGDDPEYFYRVGIFESSMKGISKLWADPNSRRLVKII